MELLYGLLGVVGGDALFVWFGALFEAEVTKMTIAFLIASELHSRKVKKEFKLLRGSIDHVAEVMGGRIESLDQRLARVETKLKGEG